MPMPSVNGAVEVASWCDEEGHFGSFLGSRSFVGARQRSRHRRRARPQRPIAACGEALQSVGLAGRARAHCRARPTHRLSRGAYRAGRPARERAASRSASSPRSSASGNIASPSPASRTMPAPRGWRSARTRVLRWRNSASRSTTAFRPSADRARSGPPAASRSIPARPASSPAARKCCSRSATTIPP